MAVPLRAVVAQRTAQRPGRRQPLGGEFLRQPVKGGEMRGVAAAEADLGHQARGTRQQRTHRRRFAFGDLPVAIEGTARLLDHAHARGHHHQAGWRRDDARGRERRRITRQVRFGQRQETAQAVVEDEHGVLALHLDAATPAVDLVPQIAGACQCDQSALRHAAPERQQ